jgi:transcriptional regulator with XRE-family HTH domain
MGQLSPVGFGRYLRDAIHDAGFTTPTQFARRVGTDPSVVLRWIAGEQRPTIKSIERIAPVLGRTIHEMVVAAYPDRLGDEAHAESAPARHRLAYELARMLADDSPLPEAERHSLADDADALLERYRPHMHRRRPA